MTDYVMVCHYYMHVYSNCFNPFFSITTVGVCLHWFDFSGGPGGGNLPEDGGAKNP